MQQNNTLSKDSADKNPFGQFSQWYKTAADAGFIHHDAMMLATADKNGKPAARIVLLKSFDEKGFVFFTNYGSRKGNELAANPYAALLFYWDKIDKQVRIEGSVEKISKEESEV
jgi:pyridoxamine 5'-phosphate oxidase